MPSHVKGFRRSVPGVINVRPATPEQPTVKATKSLTAGLNADKALTKSAPVTASALTKGLFLSATHGTKEAIDDPTKNSHEDLLEKILNAQMIEKEAVSWTEFTENSTFHGIKYVFKSGFLVRRILWVFCVVGAIVLFGVQVGSRITDYFEYATTVDVQLTYTDKIKFPAVTICNQNNFRTSKMVDNGLYYYIDEIYSTTGNSDVNMTGYDFSNVEPVQFLQDIAHQFEDLVDQCVWNGHPCDSNDFIMRFSDVGVCFTFNSNKNRPLKVKQSGSAFGLTLILNVEQYEYMKGPNNDAGVKILLHDQTEFPLMQDKGFAVAPGTHTIVVVDKKEVTSLPPLYGTCDKSMTGSKTRSDCLRTCRTEQMVRACGCMDAYMDNSTVNTRVCDVPTLFGCVKAAKESGVISDSDCDCGLPCFRHTYNPTMSYAQLSQFNIERLVLVDPANRARAEDRFLVATEYSQRVVVDTAEADEEQLTEIMDYIIELDDIINDVYDTFHSVEAFQQAYNSPVPIVNYEDVYPSEVGTLALSRQAIYSMQSRFPGSYTAPSGAGSNSDMGEMLDWFFESGNTMANRLRNCESQLTAQAFDPTFDPLGWYAQNQGVWVDYDYELFFDFPTSYNYYTSNCHFYMDPDSYRGWYPMMYEALFSCYSSIEVCDVYVATKLRHAENIRSQLTPDTGSNPRDATADQLLANYMSFIDGTFDGTYAEPESRPQHMRCLETIENYRTSSEIPVGDVMTHLEAIAASAYLAELQQTTEELNFFLTNFSATFLSDVLNDCSWYRDYVGYTWTDGICYNDESDTDYDCDTFIEYQEGLDEMDLYATSVSLLFYDISMKLERMKTTSATKLRGRLYTAIEDYLEMNITKTNLAEVVQSYVIQEAIQGIVSSGDDVISSSQEAIQQSYLIQTILQSAYSDLFGLVLPIMNPTTLVNMSFIEYYSASNNTDIQAILTNLHDDALNNVNQLIEVVYGSYYHALEDARTNLDSRLENLATSAEELEEMLVDYAASTRMNYNFYIENFLQVDIFYKELSYEIITQQPSFVFLSLLSEVGGFMGLLLGASILTVCELADYIVMTIAGKCHKKEEDDEDEDEEAKTGDSMPEVKI